LTINSCSKGKRGEREWAKYLREHGFTNARRGRQFRGSPDSPDVVDGIEGTHCEVKRTEKINVYDAMKQALDDAGCKMAYVAHRRNDKRWLVILTADDFLKIMDQERREHHGFLGEPPF
jgi:Holliday junction resolvase